jgi:hypothetical protein
MSNILNDIREDIKTFFRPIPKYRPVFNNCHCCGKEFRVPDGSPSAYDIMYCSCECMYKNMKEAQEKKKQELDREEEKILMNQVGDRFEILDL